MTSIPKVFAGGDAVLGLETLSAGIGHGFRAAMAIEDMTDGQTEGHLARPPVVFSRDLNTYYYQQKRRYTKEAIPVHERLKSFKEIYLAFDRDEIIEESNRCFSCGLCVKECPCHYIQLTLEK
jgi:NAD-dependent dihydropyrimidine dehydrogenase PreA subunit